MKNEAAGMLMKDFHIKQFLIVLLLSLVSISTKASPHSDSTAFYITNIFIKGNIKTRPKVILNEIPLKKGDRIYFTEIESLLKKTYENLINTSLFNFVSIDTSFISDEMDITVTVEERWYLWPQLIFNHADRNLNSWYTSREWGRVNYGIYAERYNFRGRMETLKIRLIRGFSKEFSLYYQNIAIDKNRKHFLSASYSSRHQNEVFYKTVDNKLLAYKDNKKNILRETAYSINYNYRLSVRNKAYFAVKKTNIDISDTLRLLNPEYLGGDRTQIDFFALHFGVNFNQTDDKSYPLTGNEYKLSIAKTGLGIYNDVNLIDLNTEISHFQRLAPKSYFATNLSSRILFGENPSFIYRRALGYDNQLRGFEYYVIDGTNFFTFKTDYKYNILPKRIIKISKLKYKQFNKAHIAIFAKIFFDYGYVVNTTLSEESNSYPNQNLFSTGLGLDVVTYYDKIIRFEYSFNNKGEHGLYIHFKTPF